MSSPGSLLSPLLFFSRSFLFYFVCVCLFSFHSKSCTQNLFRIRFLSLSPPFYYLLFPGLCIPLFFYSLVNSSSLWRSSSACHHPFFWGLFFALPPCRRLGVVAPPSSYKDQTLTVDRTAGHFGQDREDLHRPVISTF
ncbi:hypothetical protein V8C43DRAFT_148018 [Trichoderma afarasin]